MQPSARASRTPMTATQKVLAHATGRSSVRTGDRVTANVDWIVASELALKGMQQTHVGLGRPALKLRDRTIVAVDHTVSPWRNLQDQHKIGRDLSDAAIRFASEQDLKYFYPANETILHTRPYEQLFRPGDVIVGADSHTIMHGGLGAFAIGLGAADVMSAAVLGRVMLRVPESVQVKVTGKPTFSITGKDVILHLLREHRRNTVAFERTVEFTGNGLAHLSASHRGTIANMGAEFGALNTMIPPDEVIARFLATRSGEFAEGGLYFQADEDAEYDYRIGIDLASLEPLIAVDPSPDNVQSASELAGKPFDIAFVGSCTATPEEFVLAGFMAKAALDAGLRPRELSGNQRRSLAPSSQEIGALLSHAGLIDPLKSLGFQIGLSGCSLCLGVDGDGAPAGAWVLGTHNRTFPNRTGRGAFSMAANAGTVVASAASMTVTDPRTLLRHFDHDGFARVLADMRGKELRVPEITLAQPGSGDQQQNTPQSFQFNGLREAGRVQSKAIVFGDNIDTDAMIAGRFCHLESIEELGLHAFENMFGEGTFQRKVREDGHGIVVAGSGWGSGSSREEAVYALIGAGVKLVIADDFAFIHRRNLYNQTLPFRQIDPSDRAAFHAAVAEGAELDVDLVANTVTVVATGAVFKLLPIRSEEQATLALGGLASAYQKFGDNTPEAIDALAGFYEPTSTGDQP